MIRPVFLIAALAAFQVAPMPFAAPAAAQSLFSPRLIVNGRAITEFEVQQRVQMLRLFQTPGDIEAEAIKALTEDRLRMVEASKLGIRTRPDQLLAGMEEFASRANLTAEQFIAALAEAGVSAQTFRDFVDAGLVWREVVRQKFLNKVIISDPEIDRAIAKSEGDPNPRFLLSEIVIPVGEGEKSSVLALALSIRERLTDENSFAAAARTYSASATAGQGGKVDWVAAAALPPVVAGRVAALEKGEISQPIDMENAVGLFLLRDEQLAGAGTGGAGTLKYATYLLAAGKTAVADAAKLRAKVDACDDLYTVAKGQAEDRLTIETKPLAQIPADIGLALAKLDVNESVDFGRGGAHVFLMLCARNPVGAAALSRDEVRSQLVNQRLAALAETYMEELRADALIREP